MTAIVAGLGAVFLVCLAGVATLAPAAATVVWVLVLETSPDDWMARFYDGRETILGVEKAAGLALAMILALRGGVRTDRYNPGFAFMFMFGAGLVHGLFAGLSVLSSLRSLVGSAAPFAFGFARAPASWCRAVIGAVKLGPAFAVAFGFLLQALGLHSAYALEQGALRLGGPGEPPFLAGFALIGIYAGLLEILAAGGIKDFLLLVVNFSILLLTGARAPLALAVVVMIAALLLPGSRLPAGRRLLVLAGAGAMASLSILFLGSLSFIRVIGLARLGEARDLSNRGLVWPIFERAIAASPWFGSGVGAGKVIVPVGSDLGALIGTNAAHNEFLRIAAEGGYVGLALLIILMAAWVARGSRALAPAPRFLMRLIMLAFAVHSATDNTLIATTSSVFFIWVSAIFATAGKTDTAAA
jgi:O-antigen ligase